MGIDIDEIVIRTTIEACFKDRVAWSKFFKALNRCLDEYSDERMKEIKENLIYWATDDEEKHKIEKMNKIELLNKHFEMP